MPHPIVAFLAANPDCATALRAYRKAAKAYLLDSADRRRGIRRKPIKAEDLGHWTVVLFNDFSAAGPRDTAMYGFSRAEWPPLQVLRNDGPAFEPGFAEAVDAALDEVARG